MAIQIYINGRECMNSTTSMKKKAADFAVDNFIKSGMVVGLGVGSTAIFSLYRIAEKIASGELNNILGIPCSQAIQEEAISHKIPLGEFSQIPEIDVTIDGADEVDVNFNLIKGGGGALLREKIVAQYSKREVIIVDESKYTEKIGTNWHVPIEVTPFGWETHLNFLSQQGGKSTLRKSDDGSVYYTDQNNYILDVNFGIIENINSLDNALNKRVGIVAHGLFINLATDIVIASTDQIKHYKK
jgi:ribose 5-phosphate isomerase A